MPIILDTPEPPGEQLPPVNQVSVVEMRILPRKDGKGRVAAFEILVTNTLQTLP